MLNILSRLNVDTFSINSFNLFQATKHFETVQAYG